MRPWRRRWRPRVRTERHGAGARRGGVSFRARKVQVQARRRSRRWRPLMVALALAAAIGLASVPISGHAAARVPSFQGALLGTFQKPTYVTQAPGDPQLVFVVEQQGRVMLLRNGKQLTRPFLNISSMVLAPGDAGAGGEEGLLSIAFPPDYQCSGRFYVYFTNNSQAIEVDELDVS